MGWNSFCEGRQYEGGRWECSRCNGADKSTVGAILRRYLQIFRKLEESYDQMVHPQKRMDIKKALEAVMGRVLEVKEILIELNKKVMTDSECAGRV